MAFTTYTNRNIEEVFGMVRSSERGLSESEAANRLKTVGPNEIEEKEAGIWTIVLRQVSSPFFYLLVAAAVIAMAVGELIDGLVIMLFVFINFALGLYQEGKAQHAAQLLKKYIPRKTQVRRDGKEKMVERETLVPGDIVILDAGDIVPADLRVLKISNFLVDESVLSGESVPVAKENQAAAEESKEITDAKNMVFAGTSVVSGEAEGIVTGTAKQTAFGEVTKLVAGITRESAYEKELLRFGRFILRIVVTTIVFVFITNLIIKGSENITDFLIFSIALLVSIIPEALPVVVTIALSEGALRLAKEKVVVKRLSAVEDLGDIEVLCCDKTGTLTENKLILEGIHSSDKDKTLLYGLLSSHYIKKGAKSAFNPFDAALLKKAGEKILDGLGKSKEIYGLPFDLGRLRNSSLVEDPSGNRILIVKGAPETILKICSRFGAGQDPEKIQLEFEKDGREGKRILAVAFKEYRGTEYEAGDEKNLTWLGHFAYVDPLKPTAKEAVQLAEKLGVGIKLITGDTREVAAYMALKIDLIDDPARVVTGEALSLMDAEAFARACGEFAVFARIAPAMKYRIVQTLQKKYEVGFMGEGFNDAPALKAAHVAIAVENAADVAREASDIVLLQKDLKVIVEGIKKGRVIFANINKYMRTSLSNTFGNFYTIALISLIIPFLPMLPVQILLINLLVDAPLIAIVTDTIDIEELQRPRTYRLSNQIPLIIFLALTSSIFDFIFFGIFRNTAPAFLQTLWFIENIVAEILFIFVTRTSHFALKAKAPSLALAALSALIIGAGVILPFTGFGQETFHLVNPGVYYVFVIFAFVFFYLAMSETIKLIFFRYWRDRNPVSGGE